MAKGARNGPVRVIYAATEGTAMHGESPARESKHKPVSNPVIYTEWNQRILPLKRREARKLIAYGYAKWRGRKEGQAVTALIGINAVLAFVGLERLKPDLEARAADSKTTRRELKAVFSHTRNDTYSTAARHLTEQPFLSEEYAYCDLALEAYLRDQHGRQR